jgi:hypothetical protein
MILNKRIWPLLVITLLVAAASCFGPRVYPYDPILRVSIALSGLWGALVLLGILWWKKQGLWLLLGAPLALYVPVGLILLVRACHQNINACP